MSLLASFYFIPVSPKEKKEREEYAFNYHSNEISTSISNFLTGTESGTLNPSRTTSLSRTLRAAVLGMGAYSNAMFRCATEGKRRRGWKKGKRE